MGPSPHDVTLRQIGPTKSNQNAYVESLNGRLRDECLNEHWFVSLKHAPDRDLGLDALIQIRATESALSGLRLAHCARQLASKIGKFTLRL